ncbi:hypothetical protein MMC10_007720 [Thelotrema lepadinum]|nr:hypothetical protein [Thelotrema lepadinum]
MTKIVAKETGPAARRARKRSRRNGGGTSVETVDQNSEPIVDSKGKDRKASTKYPSNSQSTSKNESAIKSGHGAPNKSEPVEIRHDSEPSSNTGGPSISAKGNLEKEPLQEPQSEPIPEPVTPQLLPASDLSSPDTPLPLSRSSSTRGWPPEEQTKPAPATKDRRSRFFPTLSSLTSWRSKSSKESDQFTSNSVNGPRGPPQPQINLQDLQRCAACKVPATPKRPHRCSVGMDIDDCRAEKKKRRQEKEESEAGVEKDSRDWTIL